MDIEQALTMCRGRFSNVKHQYVIERLRLIIIETRFQFLSLYNWRKKFNTTKTFYVGSRTADKLGANWVVTENTLITLIYSPSCHVCGIVTIQPTHQDLRTIRPFLDYPYKETISSF